MGLVAVRPHNTERVRGETDWSPAFVFTSIQLRLSAGRITVHVPSSIGIRR